jgi:hypothetical protein
LSGRRAPRPPAGLDGKRLVACSRSQKATLTLKPAAGKAATRTLTLRRG